MDQAKRLSLFSDSELGSRAPPGFPVGCPTLDVMTTWDSGSKSLFIYRPPGQVVSKIHQVTAPGEAAPETVAVTWKPDGAWPPRADARLWLLTWTSRAVPGCGLE